MSLSAQIEKKLRDSFRPVLLTIDDVSASHRGHVGWRPGGETHFNVLMVSEAFEGKTRVERERWVHAVLRHELTQSLHALSLTLKTPNE